MAAGAKWTEEDVALLRALWAKGDSASAIAKRFAGKFSRSAVLGKADRLKLQGRDSSINRGWAHRTKPRLIPSSKPKAPKRKAPKPPQTQTPTSEAPVPCGPVGEFSNGCQFISGPYTPDFVMCGHPIVRGRWCSYHAGICYAPAHQARRA